VADAVIADPAIESCIAGGAAFDSVEFAAEMLGSGTTGAVGVTVSIGGGNFTVTSVGAAAGCACVASGAETSTADNVVADDSFNASLLRSVWRRTQKERTAIDRTKTAINPRLIRRRERFIENLHVLLSFYHHFSSGLLDAA
jgi:hypothetical protein